MQRRNQSGDTCSSLDKIKYGFNAFLSELKGLGATTNHIYLQKLLSEHFIKTTEEYLTIFCQEDISSKKSRANRLGPSSYQAPDQSTRNRDRLCETTRPTGALLVTSTSYRSGEDQTDEFSGGEEESISSTQPSILDATRAANSNSSFSSILFSSPKCVSSFPSYGNRCVKDSRPWLNGSGTGHLEVLDRTVSDDTSTDDDADDEQERSSSGSCDADFEGANGNVPRISFQTTLIYRTARSSNSIASKQETTESVSEFIFKLQSLQESTLNTIDKWNVKKDLVQQCKKEIMETILSTKRIVHFTKQNAFTSAERISIWSSIVQTIFCKVDRTTTLDLVRYFAHTARASGYFGSTISLLIDIHENHCTDCQDQVMNLEM